MNDGEDELKVRDCKEEEDVKRGMESPGPWLVIFSAQEGGRARGR